MAYVRFCFLLLLAFVTAEAAASSKTFPPPGLDAAARAYQAEILGKAPPQPDPLGAAAALDEATQALAASRRDEAVAALEQGVQLSPAEARSALWLRIAETWILGSAPNTDRALEASWLAYASARKDEDRHAALWRIADLFENNLQKPRFAFAALKRIAQERPVYPGLAARLTALQWTIGLEVERVTVDAQSDQPRLCIRFSNPIRSAERTRYEDYVQIEPVVDLVADASEETLCLSGVRHGTRYELVLREGLPGRDGLILREPHRQEVNVSNRPPLVAFRGDAFILPRSGPQGVPLSTVNIAAVEIKVYRVRDRNLAPQLLIRSRLFNQLTARDGRSLARDEGEQVWKGTIDVADRLNETVTTALPVDQMLGTDRQPGVYAMTASAIGLPPQVVPWRLATQWLVVTDVALTAMQGADGLHVFARALSTAKPVAGLTIAAIARNNTELARVETDQDGRAHFDRSVAGLTGGQTPALVLAYGADGDFALLDLTKPAFDLSDRGVAGRAMPGPLDAFLYTDRGVYRPGATVHVTALLRDDHGRAVENFPLTLKVRRPNGTVASSAVATSVAPGAHVLPLTLTATAPLGSWTVEALGDPEAAPVGRLTFQVDEFIPERLAVDVTGSAPAITAGQPFGLTIASRYLYGAPAAGLDGTARVQLEANPNPYPAFAGYRFGLVQETLTARAQDLSVPATDALGVANVPVALPVIPDTTRPLKARFEVAVQEPGGRPTRQTLTVPVRHQPFAIGLKPLFGDNRVGEGQDAAFDVIALTPEGIATDRNDLVAELFEEEYTYQWFIRDGRYAYRTTVRSVSRRRDDLALSAPEPERLRFDGLDWGRYRLEISDPATGVATSERFSVGWQVASAASDAPDKLELSADREFYRTGETARLRLNPPFAGEALITVATDRLVAIRTVSVPADGKVVTLPVTDEWGMGAYVTATIYRPPHSDDGTPAPVRALGLQWVGVDPAERTLSVSLPNLPTVRPRQTVEIPVEVKMAGGAAPERAWVTLAAVDEGILQLTRFASPDPGRHFLGRRTLGVDVRDTYGRLIAGLSGPMATIRSGGDGSLAAGLPDVPVTIVSLFHGPVPVNADGIARIPIDIPDFNGELRLMAVAFDERRVGSGASSLTVRDPVVVEMTTPRFLAPGDRSQLTLSIHNVEGEPGDYAVEVTPDGGVTMDPGAARQSVALAQDGRTEVILPLRGNTAGRGRVTVAVTGPSGFAVERQLALTIRPVRPAVTRFQSARLTTGAVSRFGPDLIGAYVPGTSTVRVTFANTPPLGLTGLIAALDRYPYGCVEQIVSRALPLIYIDDVEAAAGLAVSDAELDLRARIDRAIGEILDKQRYDGAFGVWSGASEAEPWLTAYALEFLTRARAAGHGIPSAAYEAGLTWLSKHAVEGRSDPEGLASRAYALHVLAIAGVAEPGTLRYFTNTFDKKLPTPLSRGQLAAALARLGNEPQALDLAKRATTSLTRDFWAEDYGSTTRDAAALLTVLGEVDLLDGRLPMLVDRLPAGANAIRDTNTQEQAWLVLAAKTLMTGTAPLNLDIEGVRPRGTNPVFVQPPVEALERGVTVVNRGDGALWQAVAVTGISVEPPAAAREGLAIKRQFFDRRGEPLDLDAARPGDVFVLVIEGEATTGVAHQAIVTHGLPAGWEIEKARLSKSELETMPWLGAISEPTAAEGRDDRFVAAVDLTATAPTFRLAALIRVVTPGEYELPGAVVEDMYRPRFFARQAARRITIAPGY